MRDVVSTARRMRTSLAAVFVMLALAAGLTGCQSTQDFDLRDLNLLGLGDDSDPSPQAPGPGAGLSAPLALAPIVGAPPAVSKKLTAELISEARARNINIITGGSGNSPYIIRGYLAASPGAKGPALAYIWDVTGKDGKRAHRILGEEPAAKPKKGSDPWSGVSDAVIRAVAVQTAAKLAAWAPNSGLDTVPAPPAAPRTARIQPAADPVTTASLPRKSAKRKSTRRRAYVVPVKGAPGDGRRALTNAMRVKLSNAGIALARKPGAGIFQVKGAVKMGRKSGGMQPISIDWVVLDPKGRRLGTINQSNKIPAGALDKKWGKTAEMAAGAAAGGVIKLLPKPRS